MTKVHTDTHFTITHFFVTIFFVITDGYKKAGGHPAPRFSYFAFTNNLLPEGDSFLRLKIHFVAWLYVESLDELCDVRQGAVHTPFGQRVNIHSG